MTDITVEDLLGAKLLVTRDHIRKVDIREKYRGRSHAECGQIHAPCDPCPPAMPPNSWNDLDGAHYQPPFKARNE